MFHQDPKKPKKDEQSERRRFKRVSKNFILTYFDKNEPNKKYEITQLRNISMGGMCFITTKKLKDGIEIAIELKTPYLSDTTHLEGIVLESHEKVTGMIYETRLQFSSLSPQAEFLLTKLIEYFTNEEDKKYE